MINICFICEKPFTITHPKMTRDSGLHEHCYKEYSKEFAEHAKRVTNTNNRNVVDGKTS